MSQEYTEDKKVTLKKLSSGRRLLEAVLMVVTILAAYLMVALLSFNPSDPSWSQTAWHEPIHNICGGIGAWMADTLFFIFGVLAYAIPPIMVILCWVGFRQRGVSEHVDYFALSLRLIGTLALILTSCGLAAFNIDDLYYFASGGVIGSLFSNAMLPWFNGVGATLTLLCIWAVGLTLFTGWSWLAIAEKIGSVVLGSLALMTNRSRREARYDDEDEDYWVGDTQNIKQDQRVASNNVAPVGGAAAALAASTVYADDEVLFSALSVIEASAKGQSSPLVVKIEDDYDPLLSSLRATDNDNHSPLSSAPAASTSASVISHNAAPLIADETTIPPLYSFEILQETPSPTQTHITTPAQRPESQMGIWDAPQPSASHSPFDFSAAQRHSDQVDSTSHMNSGFGSGLDDLATGSVSDPSSNSTVSDKTLPRTGITIASTATTFMPAFTASSDSSAQIKQGIGPELPRPNPVRIPTRRELSSYGIKLPSQRMAEQEQRECGERDAQSLQNMTSELGAGTVPEDEQALKESALKQPFAVQQQHRYGTVDSQDPINERRSVDTSNAFTFSPYTEETAPPVAEEEAFRQDVEPITTHQSPPYQAHSGQSVPVQPAYVQSPVTKASTQPGSAMDSLIHPFLMRNDQPLVKSTTPLPTLDLLSSPPAEEEPVDMFVLEQTARLVEARLGDYRVKAEVVGISPGPVITRFELDLAPGVKASRISNLSRDLARSLSAIAVRVVEVIPGKPYVGLELPNKHRQTVYLREVLDCTKFRDNPSPLAIVLGKDISGQPVVADLAKMPHLLVAGTTGSGKSVGVNAMILSILYKATPEDVRFIMIDPKMLELSVYEGIPHLLTEVVTDMKDAANALRWCVSEMERRYKLMSALGVRNLAGYNERVAQAEAMGRPIPDPFWKPSDSMDISPPMLVKLPYIVVMVDEFADLMMTVGKKVEELIARLAQKARAAGIHLVLATQRPSVDVITGLIKANIPTRIAFTVSSKIDSRTILDQAGAESLLGMGDMLYMAPNSSMPVRVHGAFVRDQEVHAVVNDWKARGRPQYIESILSGGEEGESGGMGLDSDEELDPLFDQAVSFVLEKRRASISGVQRQFRIGYNRAARIIEQMEAQQIVSTPGHNGNREVLAPPPNE